MDVSAARLPLHRLRTLPMHLGPLLHVAQAQEKCVEFGFEVHDWRVAEGVNEESTVAAGVPICGVRTLPNARLGLGVSQPPTKL